jgi:hypothetical protein
MMIGCYLRRAQRKSSYLSSGALTKLVLDHDMINVDGELINFAAKHGYLDSIRTLRGARDPSCPWDAATCWFAAKGSHLHVLQRARSHDTPCPWNEDTCSNAAEGGHLDVLQWARSQDPPCPWYEESFADYPWDYVH